MRIRIPQSFVDHPAATSFLLGAVGAAATMTATTLVGPAAVPDPDAFGQIARGLVEGHGLTYLTPTGPVPAYERGPVYPSLVAITMWLTGSPLLWNVFVLQGLLHGASTALVRRLAARVMSARSSLLVALVVGFHPLLLWYALRIWSEPLQTFLLLWFIDAILRLDSSNRWWTSAELGLACALSVLTKSVTLFLPFILLLFKQKIGLRIPLWQSLLVLGVFVGLVGTWMFHSYNERGAWGGVHTGLGFNLVQGNQIGRAAPHLPGSSLTCWEEAETRVRGHLTGRTGNAFTPDNDLFLLRIALRERVESPALELACVVLNGLSFWYLAETPTKSIVAGLVQIPVLFVLLFDIRRLWASDKSLRVALIVILYFWAIHALTVGWVRYSAPLIPLMVLLGVSAMVTLRRGEA